MRRPVNRGRAGVPTLSLRSVWARGRRWFAGRARSWALRRQGKDPLRVLLSSQRIYIFPTGSGILYGVMLATMLAGSMNYNNNLAFALTFILGGIGVATIYHTHRTLAGLRLAYLGAEPVFAGDTLDIRFSVVNEAAAARDEIFLDWDNAAGVAAGVAAESTRLVRLPLATRCRGLQPLPALRVSTSAPLGLLRAWAWINISASAVVYPRPAPTAEMARLREAATTAAGMGPLGEDDFAGLRAYVPGDAPRRIAWKSYARSGALLVQEYRGGFADDLVWLDWDHLPPSDTETRIALLARLVIASFEAGRAWGMKVPGTLIGPEQGREHLHRCLQCLATLGLPPEGRA